jgi:hypothetical protein
MMYDRIAHLFPQAREAHERARAEMLALYREVSAIQRDCPHGSTQHYPDAAGGYDSHDVCLDCGAERERGEWKTCPSILGDLTKR